MEPYNGFAADSTYFSDLADTYLGTSTCGPKRFDHGVAITITDGAHGPNQPGVFDTLAEYPRGACRGRSE